MALPAILMKAAPYVLGALAAKKMAKPLPTYQAPSRSAGGPTVAPFTPQPVQTPGFQLPNIQTPQYTSSVDSNATMQGLQGVIQRNLNALNGGQLMLPEATRNAIMGQATRSADETAKKGRDQAAESLNLLGLGGSTAMGTAFGEIERARQGTVADAADRVTQAEYGAQQNLYNSTLGAGDNLMRILMGQDAARLGAEQFGVNANLNLAGLGLDAARMDQRTGEFNAEMGFRAADLNQRGAQTDAARADDNAYREYTSKVNRQEDQNNKIFNLLSLAALRYGRA